MPSDTPKKLTFCMRLHQISDYHPESLVSVCASGSSASLPGCSWCGCLSPCEYEPNTFGRSNMCQTDLVCPLYTALWCMNYSEILSISLFGPRFTSFLNKTSTLPVHALGFGPEQGSCLSWEQGILVVWNSLKQKNQSITVDRKPETNIVRGSEQHPVTWTYLNIVQKWINSKRTSVVKPKLVLTRV